jgi:natural resistance-associated macrophage protein
MENSDTLTTIEENNHSDDEELKLKWSWHTFIAYCGPGFLIAIAYLDPGNLEADLQVFI